MTTTTEGPGELVTVRHEGVELVATLTGEGPPVLLLHGYPQDRRVWARVAQRLSPHYTVVAADLRGYGDSGKPVPAADQRPYSKRAMAGDMVHLMRELGHPAFHVVGHDRGGRVAHRLTLDHPERVQSATVIDIVPTYEVYQSVDIQLATTYFHWFFLQQPSLPEQLIGRDPDAWVDYMLGVAGNGAAISSSDLDAYRRRFHDPALVAATCADYRAGATVDLDDDTADVVAGRRLSRPILVLWGSRSLLAYREDPLAVWRRHAHHVEGHALPAGHFVVDEAPEEVAAALLSWLSRVDSPEQ